MQKLTNKTALMTGGSSGIGLADAKASLGEDILDVASDAGDVAEIDALMAKVATDLGRFGHRHDLHRRRRHEPRQTGRLMT